MKVWKSDSQLAFWTGNKRGVGHYKHVQWLLLILTTSLWLCWFMTLGKQSGYLEVHDTYTLVVWVG